MCVVTDCMTITRARIEVSLPRKRRGSCSNHDKVRSLDSAVCVAITIAVRMVDCMLLIMSFMYNIVKQQITLVSINVPLQALQRFYETVMQAILRHVRFDGEFLLALPFGDVFLCVYFLQL